MPTIQKLLHYKDMNSNREKSILINPYQCVILQKLWNSCSNWKLPVLWLADSTCTPGSKLPGQLIPAMFWKDQEWQSWGRWKGQFSFSHLHLFLSIVKESPLFYKHLSFFGAFWKSVLYWWHRFTTMDEIIQQSTWIFHTELPWARS